MTPMNRKETFLDGIANGTEVTLEPMTREEVYLKKIADSGGSGGGVLVVHLERVGDDGVLDKTWAEIDAADVAVIVYSGGIFHSREFVASTEAPDGACIVRTIVQTPTGSVSKAVYITDTADGYPVRQRN